MSSRFKVGALELLVIVVGSISVRRGVSKGLKDGHFSGGAPAGHRGIGHGGPG
jgi:hypothetical protein